MLLKITFYKVFSDQPAAESRSLIVGRHRGRGRFHDKNRIRIRYDRPRSLPNVNDDGVLIAVDGDVDDFLCVAGLFALDPEFLTEPRSNRWPLACDQGLVECGGIHEGDHEDFVGVGIDRDGGDQAVGIELEVEGIAKFLFGGGGHRKELLG